MTRVRFSTSAFVLGAFLSFSVLVSAARVGAQNPVDPMADESNAAQEVKAIKVGPEEAIDVKQFRLMLTYRGDSDKPFYNITLSVPPVAEPQNSFELVEQISDEQARRLIKQLSTSAFFEHAQVTDTPDDPRLRPQYLLRVQLGDRHFQESLGWNIGTLIRLREIRKTLDGGAAKSMGQLLSRLDGQRKMWESGEVVGDLKKPPSKPKWGEPKHGLRTRLIAAKQVFHAGEAIPVKLEIENVGDQVAEYQTPAAPHNHSLNVVDENGQAVPYLGGLSQVQVQTQKLEPGQSREMTSFDLAESFYLRRPGRYSVEWPGEPVLRGAPDDTEPRAESPASAPLEFDVIADDDLASADGDPIGRLLPLVYENWWLGGGSSHPAKLQPGANRGEVVGRFLNFQYNPTGYKVDSGLVWLWLVDEPATEQPVTANWPPPSEYLGKIDRWHVYIHVDAHASKAWPGAKDEIQQALRGEN